MTTTANLGFPRMGARRELELTKWSHTNDHCLVPQLEAGQRFSYAPTKAVAELRQAGAAGIATRRARERRG